MKQTAAATNKHLKDEGKVFDATEERLDSANEKTKRANTRLRVHLDKQQRQTCATFCTLLTVATIRNPPPPCRSRQLLGSSTLRLGHRGEGGCGGAFSFAYPD